MKNIRLIISSLSAWLMAFIHDRIEIVTGVEIDALLWAAVVIMVVGL